MHSISSLKDIAAQEAALLAETEQLTGDLWILSQDAALFHGELADAIEAHAPESDVDVYERALAANTFLRGAQRSALLEFLDLGRRHQAEAHAKRRRSIDLIVHAWIAWTKPGAARVWIKTRTNRKALRATFGNHAMRYARDEIGSLLPDWHDKLSERVHPGLASLAGSIRMPEELPSKMYRVSLFDTRVHEGTNHGATAIAEQLLDAILCHIELQAVIAGLCLSSPPWQPAKAATEQRLVMLRDRYDSQVETWSDRLRDWAAIKKREATKARNESRQRRRALAAT